MKIETLHITSITHKPRSFDENNELSIIFTKIKRIFPALNINSAVIDRYSHPISCMPYHSDEEPEIDVESPIISISHGKSRKMYFKNKENPGNQISITLEHGELLIKSKESQKVFEHSMPPYLGDDVVRTRLSITFRSIMKPPRGKHPKTRNKCDDKQLPKDGNVESINSSSCVINSYQSKLRYSEVLKKSEQLHTQRRDNHESSKTSRNDRKCLIIQNL